MLSEAASERSRLIEGWRKAPAAKHVVIRNPGPVSHHFVFEAGIKIEAKASLVVAFHR